MLWIVHDWGWSRARRWQICGVTGNWWCVSKSQCVNRRIKNCWEWSAWAPWSWSAFRRSNINDHTKKKKPILPKVSSFCFFKKLMSRFQEHGQQLERISKTCTELLEARTGLEWSWLLESWDVGIWCKIYTNYILLLRSQYCFFQFIITCYHYLPLFILTIIIYYHYSLSLFTIIIYCHFLFSWFDMMIDHYYGWWWWWWHWFNFFWPREKWIHYPLDLPLYSFDLNTSPRCAGMMAEVEQCRTCNRQINWVRF